MTDAVEGGRPESAVGGAGPRTEPEAAGTGPTRSVTERYPGLSDRVLFGAAYYAEYQPVPRLEQDLDLMREAGFSVIRVGESVWSTWEPEDGRFDLDWLQPVLDGAHERGIRVVLGTPTYAVPPWLARRYPEINVHRRTGQPMGWGSRQEIDYSHPAFLFHAERVVRRVVARYVDHPAVVGFQVDNEPGNEIFYNPQVFQRFVDHLRHTYGDVETINREWGLTYWSHRLSTWADLWTPDLNAQPQYALAWRKFQATLTTGFIGWQADVVREHARDDQFVTTCFAYERPTLQDEAVAARLDVTSGNAYYRMQDHLALPTTDDTPQHWMTQGTWSLYATADRMYASRQEPFLVTETDATAIGSPWQNEPAYDGQWRQVAWALVSRGATMIEYWHWHTLHYGTETYWGGVLPHSLEPGRVYRQVAALGAELAAAGDRVVGLVPDHDVTVVWDNASKWALQEHPAFGGGLERHERTFQTTVDSYLRGAFEAGLSSRIVHAGSLAAQDPAAFAARHPVLVAAALTVLDDATLVWLRRYAEAGGHLLVGVRTGYEDHEARARLERKPAHLAEAAGTWYDEFSTVDRPVPVRGSEALPLPDDAAGRWWVDGLQADGSEVLAGYDHPHFGRFAAVTTRAAGSGRVTMVGTVPSPGLAAAVLGWAHGAALDAHDDRWRPQADTQTVTGARNRRGERLRFVHNWSWNPSTFTLPEAAADVTGERSWSAGEVVELGAWDVRVLVVTEPAQG